MENLHQGIEHVAVYIDDIMITGPSEDEYLCTLDKVLGIVEDAGMHIERERKCFHGPKGVVFRPHHQQEWPTANWEESEGNHGST